MGLLTGKDAPRFSQYTSDIFFGDGTTTTFSLSRTPPSSTSLLVTVDGVKQHSNTYSVSTGQIIFTEAPPNGSSVECVAIGTQGSAMTPTDGSVTTAKLANGSVTKTKLDTKVGDGTGAVVIPSGTTAQRPAGEAGAIRHNQSTGLLEYYDTINSKWTGVGEFSALGGNSVTEVGGYRIHKFTSSGSFQVISGTGPVEYLVVGGGAGGGSSFGGGGGAGGFRTNVAGSTSGRGSSPEGAMTISVGTYSVIVGAGGTAPNGNAEGLKGGDSSFNGIVSLGGGGGGCQGVYTPININGGCGGGPSHNSGGYTGQGTAGQGYNSGNSYNAGSPYANPGGGGAGETGLTPSNASTSVRGGNGQVSSITGAAVTYAGGGGGGGGGPSYNTNTSGASGGAGGGGAGGPSADTNGQDATANTGGGGGGSHSYNNGGLHGGYGGSGVVIIRYKIA